MGIYQIVFIYIKQCLINIYSGPYCSTSSTYFTIYNLVVVHKYFLNLVNFSFFNTVWFQSIAFGLPLQVLLDYSLILNEIQNWNLQMIENEDKLQVQYIQDFLLFPFESLDAFRQLSRTERMLTLINSYVRKQQMITQINKHPCALLISAKSRIVKWLN